MGIALEIKNLVKKYGKLLVLDRWNLKVTKDEKLVLLGPSGCGKTTFLKIIANLEKYDTGEIHRNFKSLGFVFQEPRLIPWKTVEKNLSFVLDDKRKIKEVLSIVKLEGFENHFPSQLSGGMKQRVNLARAFLKDPDFLILDEPFSSLDLPVKFKIMDDIIKLWKERKFTLLMVTHDVKEAVYIGDRIIILSERPSRVIKEINLNFRGDRILDERFLKVESQIIKMLSSS